MDGLEWKILFKWMIWGYPYFWKHPNVKKLCNLSLQSRIREGILWIWIRLAENRRTEPFQDYNFVTSTGFSACQRVVLFRSHETRAAKASSREFCCLGLRVAPRQKWRHLFASKIFDQAKLRHTLTTEDGTVWD